MGYILKRNLGEIYLERVRRNPDLPLFQSLRDGQWRNYKVRDFDPLVRQVAYGLMNLGINKGAKVALLGPTSFEWAVCDLGILGAGGICVPVYPSLTADDTAEIIAHSDAEVLIVDQADQLAKVLTVRADIPNIKRIIVMDPYALAQAQNQKDVLSYQALREIGKRQESRAPKKFEKNLAQIKPDDLYSIVYTSGTTGAPKGVMITHENLITVLKDSAKVFSGFVKSNREVVLTFLPFSHILGRIELAATFVFGWKMCFAQNMETLASDLQKTRPTLLFGVPRVFEKAKATIQSRIQSRSPAEKKALEWALSAGSEYYASRGEFIGSRIGKRGKFELAKRTVGKRVLKSFGGNLRTVVCGGAPLPIEIAQFFRDLGLPILEGYGLTETCAPVCTNTPDAWRLGTVGRPMPEASIKIASDGEILIQSKRVFKAYYKDESATQEAFTSDGWFKTGDIGQLDQDGYLSITDRKKDILVTSAGKNIAPQKIETLICSRPYIHQAVVIGDRKNYLSALITLDREQTLNFAKEQQILFSDWESLTKHPKVQNIAHRAIEESNSMLSSFETIKKFLILPRELTVDAGELTPSLKIKRRAVTRKYRNEIENLYS